MAQSVKKEVRIYKCGGQDKPQESTMTAKEGETFVKMKNPYTFGVPVRGERFFGREEELELIFNTLENIPRGQKQDLVILGPRRIGKSSLLYRLVDLLKPHMGFTPVYIDVQNIKPRNMHTLFLKVLEQVLIGYQDKSLATLLPHFETLKMEDGRSELEYLIFNEDLTNLNHAIAIQGLPRLVLMFDEVEILVEFGGRDTLDWFRSLIQSMPYCIFVIAGSEQLYSLTQDYGSPFYNIFKTIELHPLTPEEARRLLEVPAAEIGLQISLNEVKNILRYAGNNPYFIQGIAHYLVEELNFQKRHHVYPEDVDKVIQACTKHFASQFSHIWITVSQAQKTILYELAKSGMSQKIDQLLDKRPRLRELMPSKEEQQQIFEALVKSQILVVENENRYWFVVLLFAEWISSTIDDEEISKPKLFIRPESSAVSYSTAAIRQFLLESFNDEEFNFLCFDHFKEVYDLLVSGMTQTQKAQLLIEHLQRRGRIVRLMTVLERERPELFKVYFLNNAEPSKPFRPLDAEQAYRYYATQYGIGYNALIVQWMIRSDGSAELSRQVDVEAFSPIDILDTYLTIPERTQEEEEGIEQVSIHSLSKREIKAISEKSEPGKLSVLINISPPLRPGDTAKYLMIQQLPPALYAIQLSPEEIRQRKTPFDYSGWSINRPTRKLSLEVVFPDGVKPKVYNVDARYASASSFPSERLHYDERARLRRPQMTKEEDGNYHLKLEVDYPMIGIIYMLRWQPIEK